MNIQRSALALACISIVLAAVVTVTPARGQQDAGEVDGIEAAVGQDRTIYVPFAKLKEVFEREGRGVFLPYDQFEKLWKAAQEQPERPPAGPPVDSLITAISNRAEVGQDVVRVTSVLTIELLKRGWNRVPLRLQDAAILSATIDGQAARVVPASAGGYELLFENQQAEPTRIELSLVYARAFVKTPGRNSVEFAAPLAPVNRWEIRIPQAGVKVNVDPMIVATEELTSPVEPAIAERPPSPEISRPADQLDSAASQETVLLAFVGAAPRVSIDWTPKAEGASGLEALISVLALQEVLINEGAVRTRASLTYEISRAAVSQLTVEVPAEQKVVNVYDQNVRKWSVEPGDDSQRIQVELFEPAVATQRLTIELEKFREGQGPAKVSISRIRAINVGRQLGNVVVQVDPALRAEAIERAGLQQIDASELPTGLAKQDWTFAYRYAAMPFDLVLNVETVEPTITARHLVEAYLEPEQLNLEASCVFDIQQAGVFELDFEIPVGYEVRQVVGKEMAGAAAAVVDAFEVQAIETDAKRNRLVVNLARKAIGKVGLMLRLHRPISDANLLSPTGVAASLSTVVPQARQEFLLRSTGNLVLYAPESLRIAPSPTGLRPIAFSEAFAEIPSCGNPSERMVLAYQFTDQAAEIELSVERRKPYVTAQQRMLVQVEEGVVKYEVLLMLQIQYSGVKALRVDVPAEIADKIRNVSDQLRDNPILPVPDDVRADFVAWEFYGETELIGTPIIKLVWATKIDELAVGSSTQVSIPHIEPRDVDRAGGQIVITKSETLDVEPAGELTGLRAIDPNLDVVAQARVSNAARAFEFYDDWTLQLTATRYQLEDVKRTSIERGLVRTVVTRSGLHSVRALYRIKSARQRLAIKLPNAVEFDSQPLRINGSPVALERGEQGFLTIPLAGQDPQTSFVLELRYGIAGNYQQFNLPEFPEEPAVQKVYLAAYLPHEIKLMRHSGPWTDEFGWRWRDWRLEPVPELSDDALTKWVSEGISVPAGPAFQKDGWLYLYSALRPEPQPNGSLQLWTLPDWTLNASVIGCILLLGVLLLRSNLGAKLAAILLLLLIATGLGFLAPTLAQQLLSLPTMAGLTLVGIGWCAWHAKQAYDALDWQQTLSARLSRRGEQPAEDSVRDSHEKQTDADAKLDSPSTSKETLDVEPDQGGQSE